MVVGPRTKRSGGYGYLASMGSARGGTDCREPAVTSGPPGHGANLNKRIIDHRSLTDNTQRRNDPTENHHLRFEAP